MISRPSPRPRQILRPAKQRLYGKDLRIQQLLSSLGRPPLDRLDALFQLFLDGLFGLSLDGRAQCLGPAVEVARQIRSAVEAAAVPRNELIESGFEVRLFETIVASSRNDSVLACFFCLLLSEGSGGNAATRQQRGVAGLRG